MFSASPLLQHTAHSLSGSIATTWLPLHRHCRTTLVHRQPSTLCCVVALFLSHYKCQPCKANHSILSCGSKHEQNLAIASSCMPADITPKASLIVSTKSGNCRQDLGEAEYCSFSVDEHAEERHWLAHCTCWTDPMQSQGSGRTYPWEWPRSQKEHSQMKLRLRLGT